MEEEQVGVIYNTLLEAINFSNINENKIPDRETPVEI